jgi:hypothetical protein
MLENFKCAHGVTLPRTPSGRNSIPAFSGIPRNNKPPLLPVLEGSSLITSLYGPQRPLRRQSKGSLLFDILQRKRARSRQRYLPGFPRGRRKRTSVPRIIAFLKSGIFPVGERLRLRRGLRRGFLLRCAGGRAGRLAAALLPVLECIH